MKKYMPLNGLRWSRDSGSTLCDTPQNGRSRTGWGGDFKYTYTMFFHNFFILIDLALSQFTHFFQRKLSAGSHLLQGQAHT